VVAVTQNSALKVQEDQSDLPAPLAGAPATDAKQEAQPAALTRIFGEMVDLLPTGLMLVQNLTANRFIINYANRTFGQYVQQPTETLIGQTLDHLRWFGDSTTFKEQVLACATSGAAQYFELSFGIAPLDRHFFCQITKLSHQADIQDQVMIFISDRTAERFAEKQTRHAARQDQLTGLPNRLYFSEQVENCIGVDVGKDTDDRRTGPESAVLFINVDRFQVINESLGHIAGDELLISIARRLTNVVKTGDVLARLSSDEFAIVMQNVANIAEAEALADAIHAAMTTRFMISGAEVYSSMSIGIAATFGTSRNADEIIRDADFAMHQAKSAGRRCTKVYHQASHKKARSLFRLEAELRKAVKEEQLYLAFQPLVKLSDFSLAGFEALARWDHPTLGSISPADFIPLAEETGLILPLGRWAMQAACAQMQAWCAHHGEKADHLMMGVNLSAVQLARDNMVEVVQNALRSTGLNPKSLKIELTESALVDDPERTQQVLRDLKKLDIAIALDDFGTGYSSLSYLQRFPIDILKIDRSFISKMLTSMDNQKIVGAIMSLGKSLGMEVVAEGIEKSAEATHLRNSGCEYGQGFVFSRPLTIAQADAVITHGPFILAEV
jgi:diguanylate cyclase (GGDEF)-like protein